MTCGKPCECQNYREHLLSISVAPSSLPSRGGGDRSLSINETEKRWSKDHDAYRRMAADGLQPKTLDGAAELERRATSKVEVEHGLGAPTELGDMHG